MQLTYCPQCGLRLNGKNIGDEGSVPWCDSCSRPWFGFSYPCVLCLVVDEKCRIALIKQSYVSEHFVCVAGHVKERETIEETAAREVSEELGLTVTDVRYIASYYYEKHDDLMLGFVCRVVNSEFALSCEVDSARWFTLAEALNALRPGSIGSRLLERYIRESEK